MDFTRFEASLLDPAVGTFKGWTLPNERRFNEWFAREVHEGRGAIVDLGCMNGSSTGALASGLAANGRVTGRKVQAFDRFIKTWPRIPGEPLEDIPIGGDFFHRFLEHTAPWKDLIEPYRGDAGTIAWSEGPIEYLLVDLMKSWDTASMVTERFFPLVLDRGGLVVHQDFLHFYTPWIHVIMHRLRDALEPAFEIPNSCSMVFRKVRPPRPVRPTLTSRAVAPRPEQDREVAGADDTVAIEVGIAAKGVPRPEHDRQVARADRAVAVEVRGARRLRRPQVEHER